MNESNPHGAKERVYPDNYSEAAAFAGITQSQGIQFDLYLGYMCGRLPAPGNRGHLDDHSGAPVAPPSVEPQKGGSWVCGRCGAAPESHGDPNHDAYQCVYDPFLLAPPVAPEGQPLAYRFYASESNEDGVVVSADSILANIHESMCMCDRGPDECGTEGVQGTIIEAAQALLTMGRWAIDFEDGWIKIVPFPAPPERNIHDR